MLFNASEFLFLFLPLTLGVFLLLTRFSGAGAAIAWLTLASLFFYSWWNPSYLLLILGSIAVNFSLSRLISAHTSRLSERARAALLRLGLCINLGTLAYFKYANFFVDNINFLFHAGFNFEKVILPLAISFFTFQQIVFLVAAWRGTIKGYTLLEYAFAVTFFPHLIAGPIVQYHELLPQIERERWKSVRRINLETGLTIFAIGLFKKMVLADGSAEYANPFFDYMATGGWVSTADAWIGVLAYSLQLYFDFSGYSDMAIGLARMFGLILPLNFDAPYRATSIIDFWRRWHMTLSRFLKEYVYIPLGGSRRGVMLRYANLLITMLLGGLWHGAGWTFVTWGALHGLYLMLNHAFHSLKARLPRNLLLPRPIAAAAGWTLTMLAVTIAWVFFRSHDMGTAMHVLMILTGQGQGPPEQSILQEVGLIDQWGVKNIWIATLILIVLIAPTTQQYMRRFQSYPGVSTDERRRSILLWKPSFLHGLFIGVMLFAIARRFFVLKPTEFVYFNF